MTIICFILTSIVFKLISVCLLFMKSQIPHLLPFIISITIFSRNQRKQRKNRSVSAPALQYLFEIFSYSALISVLTDSFYFSFVYRRKQKAFMPLCAPADHRQHRICRINVPLSVRNTALIPRTDLRLLCFCFFFLFFRRLPDN